MHTHLHGGIPPTTAITAADLHTMCDIYMHVVERAEIGLLVNSHFDCEGDLARIETTREGRRGITVQPRLDRPVVIRIPAWTPRDTVEVTVDESADDLLWSGHFVAVTTPAALYRGRLRPAG